MSEFEPRTALLLGALVVGISFGVISRLSAFCFRSAVLEILARRIGFQTRAWLVAILKFLHDVSDFKRVRGWLRFRPQWY